MNSILLKGQLVICGLLGLFLVMEWALGSWSKVRLQTLVETAQSSDYQPQSLPEVSVLEQSIDAFSEMVEKPLFIEGRKPPTDIVANGDNLPADVGQIEDWLLMGVYSKNEQPFALFTKVNESKKYQKLAIGQSISGWQLQAIEADHVLLEKAGQKKSLLLRKPRAAKKTQATIAKPAPQPPANPFNPTQALSNDSE